LKAYRDMGLMSGKAQYTDGHWWSKDGLKLHYRDYAGPKSRPPILCIPGLTQNARDFAAVAERLAGEWRVICIDLRGRGESAYAKDPSTYVLQTYVEDIEALITELKIKNFIGFGTALGGVLLMLLAASGRARIRGALINDIGPDIDTAGLAQMHSTIGKSFSWPTWVHAGRGLADLQGESYPDYSLVDWIAMAKRLNRLTSAGRIVPDYDLKIAESFKLAGDQTDLWSSYNALGDIPVMISRGGLSNILSDNTAKAMAKCLPGAKLVTVPRVGHAPTLDEPQARRAIDALLKAVLPGVVTK
jgi:pimeloyl-ACP methyl ester carboxylesterase